MNRGIFKEVHDKKKLAVGIYSLVLASLFSSFRWRKDDINARKFAPLIKNLKKSENLLSHVAYSVVYILYTLYLWIVPILKTTYNSKRRAIQLRATTTGLFENSSAIKGTV